MTSSTEREAGMVLGRLNMEMQVNLIHGLTSMCQRKCVSSTYKESELTVGENACVDRCVSKYFEMQAMLQEMMMKGQQQ